MVLGAKLTELITTGGLIKARQRNYCTNFGSNAEKFNSNSKKITVKTWDIAKGTADPIINCVYQMIFQLL